MIVTSLRLDLRLDGCFSLKDKRHVLRPLLEKARHHGLSAAEIADQDLWNMAGVGLAGVGRDGREAEKALRAVERFFEACPMVEIVGEDYAIERR
ncbi:DUF503 domain-containing protein [bacterium]|nr:MAG: DUF503 domain-containing protein [bacterium]